MSIADSLSPGFRRIASAGGRFRPLLYIATGFAAACGIYAVYTTYLYQEAYTTIGSSGLRRRNAVRTSGRGARVLSWSVESRGPDPNSPSYKHLTCRTPEGLLYQHTAGNDFPSPDHVADVLRISTNSAEKVIHHFMLFDLKLHVYRRDQASSETLPAQDGESTSAALQYHRAALAINTNDWDSLREHLQEYPWAEERRLTTLAIDEFIQALRNNTVENRAHHSLAADPAVVPERAEVLNEPLRHNNAATHASEATLPLTDDGETRLDKPDAVSDIKLLLYRIAEDDAKRQTYIHRGAGCDSCGALPIKGVRWSCLTCPDFDLCSTCESQDLHTRTHIMCKIRIPIPVAMHSDHRTADSPYTGDPHLRPTQPDPPDLSYLCSTYHIEDMQVLAMYHQFACLAQTLHPKDLIVGVAIDRLTFARIQGSSKRRPLDDNYLIGRLFDLWDGDKDGLICFEDHIRATTLLTKRSRRGELFLAAFDMYDADHDGYISRADLVRMLMAKHVLQKNTIISNIELEERKMKNERSADVTSLQPLSVLFGDSDIARGEDRTSHTKPTDPFGDPQPLETGVFSQTVLPDGESDIDLTFWNAVHRRYGRPRSLKDLHPRFNDTLEARREVRKRYIGSDAVPIDGLDGTAFKVPTDSRYTRRYNMHDYIPDGDRHDHVGRLDHTYEISAIEAFERQDVLFQVAEEGFNDMLDVLFRHAEWTANAVRDTADERTARRDEINKYKQQRSSELPAKQSIAEMPPDIEHALEHFIKESEQKLARATQLDEDDGHDVAPAENAESQDTAPVEPHHLNQNDLMAEFRREAVPLDDDSLVAMEASIHEQSLEELLAASGYSSVDAGPERDGDAQDAENVDGSAGSVAGPERDGDAQDAEDVHGSAGPAAVVAVNEAEIVAPASSNTTDIKPQTATSTDHDDETATTCLNSDNDGADADADATLQSELKFLSWLDDQEADIKTSPRNGRGGLLNLEGFLRGLSAAAVAEGLPADQTLEGRLRHLLVDSFAEFAF